MYEAENGGAIIDTKEKNTISTLQKFHDISWFIFSAKALYSSLSNMGIRAAGLTGDSSQGPPVIREH